MPSWHIKFRLMVHNNATFGRDYSRVGFTRQFLPYALAETQCAQRKHGAFLTQAR
jgi:hypothetical protein